MPENASFEPRQPNSGSGRSPSDVVIAGAGIIGLSLALELERRGARVTVIEAGHALQQASTAAAGMLAADDPHNPPELLPLSRLSASLYPGFLRRIEELCGLSVPFQTETTLQYLEGGDRITLAERSLDPRQLGPALLAAVRATRIDLRENTRLEATEALPRGITAISAGGERFSAIHLIHATGAWTGAAGAAWAAEPAARDVRFRNVIAPRKGQMLRVQLTQRTALTQVHRSPEIYIVPRLYGPQAGTALIGATEEDAGFDTTTHAADLAGLRSLAAHLLPELASETDAPAVEAWAGLRPASPDHLPLLGPLGETREFLATGHFRNGILLAPATALVISELIETGRTSVDLSPFSPLRFF